MPNVLPMPTNDIRVVSHEDTLYAPGGENIEPATSNTTPWLRIDQIHLWEEQNPKQLPPEGMAQNPIKIILKT